MGPREILALLCIPPALSGCNSDPNAPLVFYQATTLGVSVNATGGAATPEVSLGYRDTDVAVVPVATNSGSLIQSNQPDQNGRPFNDALSVLGQFQANTNGGAATTIGLGKFFATGAAASELADGFRTELGNSSVKQQAPPRNPL
jgi:hypothetical protein